MTNERAKSELEQLYMMLSEEKKQALDVLMAQNCDQCEVGNPCLYCEYEFKSQADGEYISKQVVLNTIDKWYEDKADIEDLIVKITYMPSVAIPPEHDGCKDCRWQSQSETEMPCKQCMHNYTDEWERAKIGHWIWQTEDIYQCSECGEDIHVKEVMNEPQYAWCPMCGCPMKIER